MRLYTYEKISVICAVCVLISLTKSEFASAIMFYVGFGVFYLLAQVKDYNKVDEQNGILYNQPNTTGEQYATEQEKNNSTGGEVCRDSHKIQDR